MIGYGCEREVVCKKTKISGMCTWVKGGTNPEIRNIG